MNSTRSTKWPRRPTTTNACNGSATGLWSRPRTSQSRPGRYVTAPAVQPGCSRRTRDRADRSAHVGKTTALVHLAAKTEQWVGKRDPAFKQQGQAPVAYIEMEPKATPKSIASSILNFYGIPHAFRSATQHQLTNLALDALRRHRTRMLIIDELQMLKLDGKSGDDAINSLKTIMNDSGATCVFAGVDLQTGLSSRAAEQIIARCTVIGMRPFSGSTGKHFEGNGRL